MTAVAIPRTDLALREAASLELTRDQAEDLTGQARDALARAEWAAQVIEGATHELAALIRRAWDGRAHRALGLPSWAAYCEQAFGPLGALRIPVVTRVALVVELTAERTDGGKRMSVRATADALRVADQTTRADLKRARALAEPAAPAGDLEQDVPAADDVVPGQVVATRALTQPAQVLADLADAGARGYTSRELGRRHRDWHTGAWAVLSVLHRQHLIERLSGAEPEGTRDGMAVYVLPTPQAIAGRRVEPPGRKRQRP